MAADPNWGDLLTAADRELVRCVAEELAAQAAEYDARLEQTRDELARAVGERDAARKELADHLTLPAPAGHTVVEDPEDPEDPEEPEPPTAAKLSVGLRSPNAEFAARVALVGREGLTNRRSYVEVAGPNTWDQQAVIREAFSQKMTPILSIKIPGLIGASTTRIDEFTGWVRNFCKWVDDLAKANNTFAVVSTWHEFSNDMTPAQFLAFAPKFTDAINSFPNLRSASIHHGFLTDNRIDEFAAYWPKTFVSKLRYAGFDTYQAGTEQAPKETGPAERIKAVRKWVDAQGFPNLELLLGEYNSYTAAELRQAHTAMLDPANKVAFVSVFDSAHGGKGLPLAGDRLTEFKRFKADPRVAK